MNVGLFYLVSKVILLRRLSLAIHESSLFSWLQRNDAETLRRAVQAAVQADICYVINQ